MHYPTPSRVHVYQKHFSPSILKVIERLALLSTESRSVFPKSFSLWKLKVDICVYVHIYIYVSKLFTTIKWFFKRKKKTKKRFQKSILTSSFFFRFSFSFNSTTPERLEIIGKFLSVSLRESERKGENLFKIDLE